jgi:hypothetical protein
MNNDPCRIVHGTPITPVRLLEPLRGSSFCVSFAAPEQLEQCIDLVGADGILVLDNGAFSHWRAGRGAIDRAAFWDWANDAMARCPQAVAVIPDVIEGDEAANLAELSLALRHGMADFPERTMSIWHLNDSAGFLETQLKLMNFVGLGSCVEYDVQRHRAAYLERVTDVYWARRAVKHATGRAPWIHLMRGLGAYAALAWAESADSTNVARNHCRRRAEGDGRALAMAQRIAQPILAAGAALPVDRELAENFDAQGRLDLRVA